MTVRIYHNHDTDAPELGNTAGSMIAVLEAVLVDGYGSKQPLGWTKEFHEGNVAVFRNDPSIPGSTGMYLRVDDTQANEARVRCYKTMSDINTGTDVIPNVNTDSQDYIIWRKHYTGSGSPKWWSIIGDERTLYMNVAISGQYPDAPTGNYSEHIHGAGDFISYVPGNEWNYMLFGHARMGATTHSETFPFTPGNAGVRTMFLGRSQALNESAPAYAAAWCPDAAPGHNSQQKTFSVYIGLRHFMPALIQEYQDGNHISGTLRGSYWLLERSSDVWFEDMGRPPGEPTGPTMRKFGLSSTFARCSLIVKEDEWDG